MPAISALARFVGVLLACCAIISASYAANSGKEPQLPRLETRVIGQTQFLAGSTGALRVVVTNHVTGRPVERAWVGASLRKVTSEPAPAKGPAAGQLLFSGRTNRDGTLKATFKLPESTEGSYELIFNAQALGEEDRLTQSISITRAEQVLLTTDKPLYQPGQLIHIRTLTLNRPNLSAFGGAPITIEVEDAKGNKVFKKQLVTSLFGIAGADFQLASEVNMGRYTIRAITANSNTEKKVTVERYVLPKFKIKFTPDKPYYLPQETINGKLQADYMFGKPVAGSEVTIKASTFDVGFKDFAEVTGRTDDSGSFSFTQELPAYFVGQPLEQGNAFVKLEIEVKDSADHIEKITQTVPVAGQALKIVIVPDGGRIVRGVENHIYFLATTPDGSPAQTDLLVNFDEKSVSGQPKPESDRYVPRTVGKISGNQVRLHTDSTGIAVLQITPISESLSLQAWAQDNAGHQFSTSAYLHGNGSEDSILLATDKALAKVGDMLNITALSPTPSGTVYLDVVRDGQTINTQSLDLRKGRGVLAVPLTEDLAGSIQIHAYRVSRSGQIVRDTRMLYVNPADDLQIKIAPDRQSYLPGGPATINFNVTDNQGRGVAAALGVSIVDESVFALQEMQPGMEKIYFLLEKEIMEPKFEVHGLTPMNIIEPVYSETIPYEKQQAAKVLFSLAQQSLGGAESHYGMDKNTYTEKYNRFKPQLEQRVRDDLVKIATAVMAYDKDHSSEPIEGSKGFALLDKSKLAVLVKHGLLKSADLQDQWGRPYVCLVSSQSYNSVVLASAGPDGVAYSSDDITAVSYGNSGTKELATNVNATAGQPSYYLLRDAWSGGMAYYTYCDDFAWPAGVAAKPAFDLDNSILVKNSAVKEDWSMRAELTGGFPGAMPNPSTVPGLPAEAPQEQVRVREYFPETMFFQPSVITDERGRAFVNLNVADSITTWRVSATASSRAGQLGSASEGLKVFQDFFIDIDLPVSLTCNDEVSIPVAVYNYLPSAQRVALELTTEPWFELSDETTKTLEIGESDVKVVYFRIKVKQIGVHKLTVHATGSAMSDAISREIEVTPDGQEQLVSINDRLEKTVQHTIEIPSQAIEDASNILVKVYPGIFSQVVEGMDSILQMPSGCFEQTSSTTYPNVLVLDYMKTVNQLKPEIRMKAEQYINLGYQRLVTFEVKGGGFSWFGDAPANKVLTAYGLMEFADMSRVSEVDPELISRTRRWLISQREKDGSWKPDANYLHVESWGKIQNSNLLPTAWITWALIRSGCDPKELAPSLAYLKEKRAEAKDPYTLAILANALVAVDKDDPQAQSALETLVGMATEDKGKVYWKSEVSTVTFSCGESANIETTGLATLALIASGRYQNTISKALTYIIQSKDPSGTWGSTQATILSLRALLASITNLTPDVNAKVRVLVNGQEAGSFAITPQDSDVLRQVDCKGLVKPGENQVKIEFSGKGSMLYQITGKYFTPWEQRPDVLKQELISIDVNFDRTELEANDLVTSTVRIAYNKPGTAEMPMVDLGIPPGFQVMSEDLEGLLSKSIIQRYSVTGRQVILYFDKLENGRPVEFSYRLKAKFPIRARTPQSRVYLYYNPEIEGIAVPTNILVK